MRRFIIISLFILLLLPLGSAINPSDTQTVDVDRYYIQISLEVSLVDTTSSSSSEIIGEGVDVIMTVRSADLAKTILDTYSEETDDEGKISHIFYGLEESAYVDISMSKTGYETYEKKTASYSVDTTLSYDIILYDVDSTSSVGSSSFVEDLVVFINTYLIYFVAVIAIVALILVIKKS